MKTLTANLEKDPTTGRFRRGQAPPPVKKPEMRVETVDLHTLHEDPSNANQHPEEDIKGLMAKLATFEQVEPLVVQLKTRKVIGGNGRLEAMRRLGWVKCAVHFVDCDNVTATALGISLNRRKSLFDDSILVEQLKAIQSENADLMDAVGYDPTEIDALIAGLKTEITPPPPAEDPGPQVDRAEELLAKWGVKLGDLWVIPSKTTPGGEHRILCGDSTKAEDVARVCDGQVQTCVTSPPYWGLRDYGTAEWVGGDEGCDHQGPPMRTNNKPSDGMATFHGGKTRANEPDRDTCGKCGALRIDAQLGLEATPEEFVAKMTALFAGVRRVLADDGTCWVNLGDSYAGGGPHHGSNNVGFNRSHEGSKKGIDRINIPGLKPKDLVGIPWRVAFALQADGWYLRSDIIWAKPNPMPESVTDRPTKSHEYVFLLSRSERYFWDQEAVKEEGKPESAKRYESAFFVGPKHESGGYSANGATHTAGMKEYDGGRNIRSVWTITPQPFPGPHFATFPVELATRCIEAGTSEKGCCPKCGKPWERVVTRKTLGVGYTDHKADLTEGMSQYAPQSRKMNGQTLAKFRAENPSSESWRPSCSCPAHDPIPCTVLDPFLGAGTTIVAAEQTGRLARGIEIAPKYVAVTLERLSGLGLEPTLSVPNGKRTDK